MGNFYDNKWSRVIGSIVDKHTIIFDVCSDQLNTNDMSMAVYDTLRVFTTIIFKTINSNMNQYIDTTFKDFSPMNLYNVVHGMFNNLTTEEKEQIMLCRILDIVTGDLTSLLPFSINFTPDDVIESMREIKFLSFDTDD